ncbi:MAG: hypothetical protein ACM3Q2_11045 [Syntrophothermus sp.]
MKKNSVLIILLIAASVINAQATWTGKKQTEVANKKLYVMKGDSAAQLVYPIDDFKKYDSSFVIRGTGVNSSHIFYPNEQYPIGYISISDTADGTGLLDTLSFKALDPLTGNWTQYIIGLKDVYDQIPVDATSLAPGEGKTKIYEIRNWRPKVVKVEWKTNSIKTNRRCKVRLVGYSR